MCESQGGLLGFLSLISLTVSVDVKHRERRTSGYSELRSCVKDEVAVLGSPSLISLMVSVDVEQL